jgi:GTP-binding protein EngB required for normal cell division
MFSFLFGPSRAELRRVTAAEAAQRQQEESEKNNILRQSLYDFITTYEIGNVMKESFHCPNELPYICISVLGQKGAGKSSFVNGLLIALKKLPLAITSEREAEGTYFLEFYTLTQKIKIIDTRGFADLSNNIEKTEFEKIVNQNLPKGTILSRKNSYDDYPAEVADINKRIHCAIFVFRATDDQLSSTDYNVYQNLRDYFRDTFKLVPICVITHIDECDERERETAINNAIRITKCPRNLCFLLHNYKYTMVDEINNDLTRDIDLLKILKMALLCAEKHITNNF